ncbi:MAG: histidinol-phosphate transaminase [Gammaproteobacteria bacterium]|nr:MAG: histidinol-phosphate transaminase [Gammaproteobacteria bacterium]
MKLEEILGETPQAVLECRDEGILTSLYIMADISKRIEQLVRPEIRALKAYGVTDPQNLIKLDAMENPYPWPEDIKQQWLQTLQSVEVNRYPDPAARRLTARLRQAMALPADQAVLLGNGSDELIQIILMALATAGARVMAPDPTFVMYAMTATFVGMEFVGVPLRADDFALDRGAMLAAIAEHQPAVIFLAYPNNPTANLFAVDDVEAVIKAAPGLVVIDEAYHAFADQSFVPQLGRWDNVVVMRTLSKLGLAGLRLGLLVGDAEWLTEFDKVRLPYNINSLTQASAEMILGQQDFLLIQTTQIKQQRQRLLAAMSALPIIKVWPSDANFILFRPLQSNADDVFEGLKQAGILIKNLSHAQPALAGCLRVTVGTPEENDAFLKALGDLV